ncbi:Uncharacterised protein [Collinsella intestinalis]|nr:Uncharacterised protein [Collinsella intestinalis]
MIGVDELGLALAVDGVVLGATVEAHQGGLTGDHEALDDAGHDEVAVAALEVDVGTGVTAEEAGNLKREDATGLVLAGDRAGVGDNDAAGAADGGHALLLGIEVDHGAGVDLGLVEGLGAHEAGLLVGGEDALEGRMGQGVVIEHGEHERDRDAIVGAQGGAIGGKDAVGHHEIDAVLGEIVLDGAEFVAHHIDMALQHDGGLVLGAGGGGLLDDHVVDIILIDPQAVVLGERHQVIADPLLVA